MDESDIRVLVDRIALDALVSHLISMRVGSIPNVSILINATMSRIHNCAFEYNYMRSYVVKIDYV